MNPTLEERWTAFTSHFASFDWERRYLPEEQAEIAILHLYHQLDEIGWISGWVGPVYRYGGGFERFVDLPATDERSRFFRDGALVMVLFATWCAAEECYVLSKSTAESLLAQAENLTPTDERDKRLISTVRFALQLHTRDGMYHNWDQMTVFRLDRESRWIVENIVRPILQDRQHDATELLREPEPPSAPN